MGTCTSSMDDSLMLYVCCGTGRKTGQTSCEQLRQSSSHWIIVLEEKLQSVQQCSEIRPGKGRIGQIDDLQPAFWVGNEKSGLGERSISLHARPWLGNVQAQ